MINYFVRLNSVDNSFLISCNNLDIKSNRVFFILNGLTIALIDCNDISLIYHFENDNYANRIYDFQNVPFPEVM